MTTVVRLALVGLAALLVAAGTGCGGGGDPSAYVKQVNEAQTVFAKRFGKLQSAITPNSSAAANRAALDRFSTTMRRTLAALRKATPPDSVKDLNDEYLAELTRYGTVIDQAEKKFASNSPQQIDSAQAQLSQAAGVTATRVNGTISKINDKLH